MKKLLLLLLSLIPLLFISCESGHEAEKQYVVILSLDGFRWDYPAYMDTPVLDSLEQIGVKALSLKASYPTKTFPNHYSIATGLYPDHHGLVANTFYAPDLNKLYKISKREAVIDGSFYGGEPIWVTAENQGLTTATFFWVGASAEIKGVRPATWYLYDESIPFSSRIDTISHWLQKPKESRPDLIMWYLHEPDHTGHEFGPYGDSTKIVVEEIDRQLGRYFHEMRKLPFFDQINFIITSDHGMAETSEERLILIDEIIDTADIKYLDGSNPNFNIKVKTGKLDKVYAQLKNTAHIYTWKTDSIPGRLHYGTNPRTHDINIVAYPGWSISKSWWKGLSKGAHGYDNAFRDMHAIFYAVGPAFKKGYEHPTFENVNIYPLIAEILGLVPAETDGNINNVRKMLKEDKE